MGSKEISKGMFVLGLFLFLILAGPAFSQTTANLGIIEGTIQDATGAVLPGATVTLLNTGTGASRTVATDEDGRFRAPLLPLGNYTITVEMPGFKRLIREGVTLAVGETITLSLTTEVAAVEETVTVVADAPVIESARTVQAASITQRAIEGLPINSRDFQDFAALTPTVVKEPGRDTISMGGQKGIDTNITLDGADFNNSFFGQATGQPEANQFVIAQEAIKEFQVLANGYSAEFGRAGGGVLNVVSKSGTNEVHGSAFLFWRTEGLTSTLDTVDGKTIPKTDFSQKQFGGSVGGPIEKDRVHYFVAAEQQLFTSPFLVRFNEDVSKVPSMTQLFGQKVAGVDNLASLEGTFEREVNLTAVMSKVDFQLNNNNSLSVRYNYSRFRGINFGASAGGVEGAVQSSAEGTTEDTTDRSHSVVVSNATVIGNNKFNEFRFHYSFETRPRFGTSNETPEVTISGCCRWGRTGFLPITSEHTRWQIGDNFSYLFGKHDLKIGADLNFTNTAQAFFGFSGGTYEFGSLDDFLDGKPRRFRQLVGLNGFTTKDSGTVDFGQKEYGIYIQDVWKPKPGFTVNLGLRWEGVDNPIVPTEEFGNPTRNPLDPAAIFGLDQQRITDDWNNFAPRIGFAWDPKNDGKTIIRGGAGVFHSRIPLLLLANILTNNGFRQSTVDVRSNLPLQFPAIFPETGLKPGDPLEKRLPPADVFFWDPDFEVPEIYRQNAGFEREIVRDFAVGFDYVHAYSIKNQRRRDLNVFPPSGTDAFGRALFRTRPRPDTKFGRFALNESTARGRYQAAIFSARKRYSHGHQFQLFYTLSFNKSEDDNERSATGISPSQPENLRVDYNWSERDVRHRFVGIALFELPGDVDFSTTIETDSGRPFDIRSGRDDNGDGLFNDRAVVDDKNRARAQAAGQNLEDGLQKRNTGRNPTFFNMDIRLTKGFSFENQRLEVLFDVFNLFNNANRRTSLGRLDRSNFGLLNLIGASRQAQLGVRWRF